MGSAVLGDAISAIRDWSLKTDNEPRVMRPADAFGSLVEVDQRAVGVDEERGGGQPRREVACHDLQEVPLRRAHASQSLVPP